MPTNRRGFARRLTSWTFALLAAVAAGLIPCRLAAREGRQDEGPTAREGHRAVADAELALARARRESAAMGVQIAAAGSTAAVAEREFREKQHARIAQLEQRGSVDRLLVDEEEQQLRGARAAENAARLETEVARARLAVAEAAIREAEAVCEIARAGSVVTPAVQAENELEDARAERTNARHRVEQAEAQAARATAFREHRKKEFDRLSLLARNNAVEPRLIDEFGDRYRASQADERRAEARVGQARAAVAVAEAAVRAAEARRDLARALSRPVRGPGAGAGEDAVRPTLARLHQARVDRARAARQAASLEADRLAAKAEQDTASVAYRIKQVERIRQLAARRAVEDRLVDEQELELSEARHIQREVEADVKAARARLDAAEARLKAVEAEADGAGL